MIPVTFLITHNIYPVFTIVFIMFLLALLFNTARCAIIPNLVSKKRILNANSVINFVGRAATFLGMFFGGIIIDLKIWRRVFHTEGWIVAFIIDAITFLVSAIMLYLMKVKLVTHAKEETHLKPKGFYLLVQSGLKRMWEELKHAIHSIIKEKNLTFAIGTIFLLIIAGSVIYVLAIPTVQQEKAWGTSGVGILASIGTIGLLLGAYLIGVFGHHYDLKTLVLGCFVLISASLVVFPFLNKFWMFALICLICGTLISPIFIIQDTLIHQYADEFIRGRIFSLRDWVLNGSFVLGALIVGSLSTLASKQFLFVLFGIFIASLTIIGWFIKTNVKGTAIPQDST